MVRGWRIVLSGMEDIGKDGGLSKLALSEYHRAGNRGRECGFHSLGIAVCGYVGASSQVSVVGSASKQQRSTPYCIGTSQLDVRVREYLWHAVSGRDHDGTMSLG